MCLFFFFSLKEMKNLVRTLTTKSPRELVKFYYDFKSPYSYLALQPTLELEKQYAIELKFLPWPFRAEETFGGNLQERNRLNWNKVRYLYLDCRRFANERGLIIRGPERLFNSRLALIAGLYADRHGYFRPFADRVFQLFFNRKLNLEDENEIVKLLYETSDRKQSFEDLLKDFQNYLNNQGAIEYSDADKQAESDKIFGVPAYVIRDELFWGHDRLAWVKKRLVSLNLARK